MQRLSLGSPGGRPSRPGAEAEADEKAAKPRAPAPGPDRSIHLVPVITLLCFLVLFLLSRDPSAAGADDSPVLAAAAVTATATATAAVAADATTTTASAAATGVYRRLKEDARTQQQQTRGTNSRRRAASR